MEFHSSNLGFLQQIQLQHHISASFGCFSYKNDLSVIKGLFVFFT